MNFKKESTSDLILAMMSVFIAMNLLILILFSLKKRRTLILNSFRRAAIVNHVQEKQNLP